MKKHPDRVFHLSIAVIAIFVTIVSVLSIIYEQMPPAVGRVLSFTHIWSSLHAKSPWLGGTAQTVVSAAGRASGGGSVSDKPAKQPANQTLLNDIHIEAVGKGATAEDVANAKRILEQVGAPLLIEKTTGMPLRQPVTIEMIGNTSAYDGALTSLGVNASEASSLSKDTGGFTQNSTILIPLGQNKDNADLANTLTHELTHAIFNQNISSLPSWMNEGIAVYMGMTGQKSVENAMVYAGYERQLAESIVDVAKQNQLQPLEADESVILSGQTDYDYELQDWLAVSDLISTDGLPALQHYLSLLQNHMDEATAFRTAFGQTESAFDASLTKLLRTSAAAADDGVTLGFNITSQFTGKIDFLQHGKTEWQGVTAKPGHYQITVGRDGRLEGSLPAVSPTPDIDPADTNTIYISLMPSGPLTWQGEKVTDCGFAFNVRDGLYSFEDTWVSLASGQTLYESTPTLFGVTITSESEVDAANPIVKLL
ncbi:hypothetical protein [Alicyclobacillus acidoterrestris]|uniref:Uncharacterized protein n=1 Tax=Alicyclobacillus acidoterrestris (strain ATCC 49025 / DSM 3922 / CIP 106132 / NCIMB 13137 / GD3B) TaxID=1356854 RepID=T0CVF8_ALIAG|nr:hypothetical protein [Alicyclobacillus acidoterrestris]EPZ43382.1 hypothetical protein N007_13240 [Alicyclobacillus acidoterrestris ATCC 49025]UNO48814.1 hypothetical protein K1I37_19600 [Alicyclobacillus acidoterrestris]